MGGLPIDGDPLKTAEVFPSQDCLQDVCSVPDLPFGRSSHTLSVLSSGIFVVCGGQGEEEQNPEESGGYGYGYGQDYGEGDGSGNGGYGEDDGYGQDNGEGEGSGNGGNGESNSTRTSGRFHLDTLKTCLTLEFAATENASWVKSAVLMRYASNLIFKT